MGVGRAAGLSLLSHVVMGWRRNRSAGNATRSYSRRSATGARSSLVQCHGKGIGESLHSASIHDQAAVWRGHLAKQIRIRDWREFPGSGQRSICRSCDGLCAHAHARTYTAALGGASLALRRHSQPRIYKCAGMFVNVCLAFQTSCVYKRP